MSKPLGPKSILIREAIAAHQDLGNKDLADLINGSDARKEDKIEVTPQDIAQQKQAMKKAGVTAPAAPEAPAKGKPGRPKGSSGQPKAAVTAAAAPRPTASASASPVDLIDKTLDLAAQAGGVAALKKLVDRLADMRQW